jgi:tRNA threonylcarbamoyl adenosine modification protein (Sua5/YciO/YrdC/YwlC family)
MTLMLSTDSPNSLTQAVSVLQQGALVAFPTDTVYGLGAIYDNCSAVSRLYTVKARRPEKAIPILVGTVSDAEALVSDFPPTARALATAFWPGALTLVMEHSTEVPAVVAPANTVAVRMPAHQWLLKLLEIVGPLAVSSANRSGQPPEISAELVCEALGESIDLIIDGGTVAGGRPSTIADCSVHPPEVLREGPVTTSQIVRALRADP